MGSNGGDWLEQARNMRAEDEKKKDWLEQARNMRADNDAGKVDDAYINAFVTDSNNYFSSSKAEYDKMGWGNASEIAAGRRRAVGDLDYRHRVISRWAEANKDKLTEDGYRQITNMLSGYSSGKTEIIKAFDDAAAFYGQWDSEEAYNTDKQNYEWSQKYQGKSAADLQNIALGLDDGAEKDFVLGYAAYMDNEEKGKFDLEAGQAEIDDMEAKLAELRRQKNAGVYGGAPYAAGQGSAAAYGMPYGAAQQKGDDIDRQIRELEKQISEKKRYLNTAKRIQSWNALASAPGNADFGQYSGYVSTVDTQGGAGDETYEWINNRNGYREQYEADRAERYKRYETQNTGYGAAGPSSAYTSTGYGAGQQAGIGRPVPDSEYEQKGYDYLKDEEIAIYNYYHEKEGKEKAQQYLDSIQEKLNQRKAKDMFAAMEGNTAAEIVFGITAGGENFAYGIKNLFNLDGEYVPASAFQYAGEMVREDLADDSIGIWYNFKEKKWEDNILGASLGQLAYDVANTTGNMAPSILAATAANIIVPGSGAWIGPVLMGMSAGGNAYQQAINEGFDKDDARMYGLMVGASEVFLEKFISGIGKFGGNKLGKYWVRNMNATDNAFKMIAKNVLGGMASEFTEEYIQEIIDPVLQNLILDTDHEVEIFSTEAVYAGILGALTAFGTESIDAGVTAARYTGTGRDLIGAGVKADDLAAVGSKFAADTVAYKLAGQIDENTNAFTMGRMFYEIGAQLTEQNVSAIAEALEVASQGLMPKKIARKNAEIMAHIVEGGNVSDFQMKMIEKNDVLAKVMREVIIDPNSTVYQRSVGYSDVLRKLAGETVEARTVGGSKANGDSEVSVATQKENGSESRSEGGTGDRKASGIVSVKKGNPVVKLDDGSEVSLQDADLSPDDALIIKTVTDIDGISAQDAGDIFKILKAVDSDPAASSLGAMEAYRYGYYGFSEKHLADNANFAKNLTETQRNAIYEIGKKARDTSVAAETDSIKQKRSAAEGTTKEPAKLHITYDQGRGRVHDLQTGTIKGLNPKQKAAVAVAKVLQGLGVGTDFEFFSSYLSKTKKDENGNRVRVFLDANGNEVVAYAGVYRTGDGKIRIDLNAYNGKGLALNAMSHELVHFIKQWSPEKYRTMAELVSGAYEKTTMSMDQRVLREQNRLKRIRKTEVSYDEAYDEVVANALNRMLDDGTIVDRIAEIRKAHRDLADKMIECIRNFAKKLASIFANNESLFYDTYDLMQFKETVDEIRNLFAEALVEASDNRLSSIEAEAVKSLGENASVETNADGEMVLAKNESGNVLMYSEQTYQNGGREKLEAALKQNGHTAEEISETLSWVDDALDYIKVLAAGYAKNMGYTKLSNHLLADIVTNVKTGKQVMSAIVNNGDYPVNIDLSLICKKRVAYMNLMSRLIRDGVFDKVNYDGAAIAEVNGILRENGFETACLGCFVESRRLQFQTWAETIVSEWNAEVEKRNPNAKFFGFAKGKMETLSDADINALTAELESVKKNDQGNVNLGQGNSVTRMGRLLDALPSLQMKLTVEDLLTPEGLTALRKHDGSLFSIVKSRYGAASPKIVQDFNPYASEIAMLTFAQVKGITNNAVKGAQAYITEVKREYGKPKKTKGESKAEFNKRKKDHEQRVQDEAMRRYLYDIGGARIQSFSDFMIENVFDYIQIFADLAAKRLPLHGYSKEIVCLRLFGMTGAKWNGSLIAHVERSMGKEYAGLLPAGTSDGIPVRVDGKDYVIGFDDYARNAATGGKSFIQSIGMKDIIALQLDPRYSPYVGNITIGVSDAQIMAMLDSPLFRMVIPYHASGMLPMFAKLVGVDMYNDYTDYQNTTVRQYYDLNGNAVTELKNAKGEAVKADTSFAFNAEIQKTGDAKTAADNYLRWCAQRHPVYDGKTLVGYATFNPKFSSSPYGNDFTRHENYYKLLEDFNTYDSVTEESAVQGAVTMNFPSEENRLSPRQMEAYKKALRDTGIFTEKEIEKYARKADMTFKEIINAEVGNRANYEVTQAPKWEATVKAVEEKLQKDYARYSSQETDLDTDADYMDAVKRGDMETAQQMVDEAANAAGYTTMGYHGSPADFTVVDGWLWTSRDRSVAQNYYGRNGKSQSNRSKVYAPNDAYGVYPVRYRLGKNLTIDADGSSWGDLPVREADYPEVYVDEDTGTITTNAMAEWAENNGYDSITFANVYDGGNSPTTVDVVFRPNRDVKSADPITYDDNGNVIPISERFNDENKDIRYSTQETDNITARDLLSGTDVATVKNEVAKKKLAGYQKTLEVMTAEEQKLREIRADIKRLSFAKGTKDTKKLKDLKSEAAKINNHLSVYEGQLQRMEKELQSVVKRERAKVVKEAEKRDKAVLAKEWMAAEVKQSETLRDLRETRAALRQQESDTAVMEKEFIRITKEYEKLDAKRGKTISNLREKLKNEAEKHRANNKMWMSEFGRLMREYDAAGRNIDRLEQKIERQKAVAKERVESRKKTDMRHKIQKTIRELNKLLNHGSKDRNVKEDMKGFVSKTLKLADYLFTDHISNEDLIRNGITVRMTSEEAALVKETESILFQIYDNADNITDAEFMALDIKRKRNLDKLRDLLAEQRNAYLNTPVYNLFNDLVTEYASFKNSKQDAVKDAYNPEVERFLRSYIGDSTDGTDSDRKTALQNMRVKDMNMDELWRLYNAYTMVLHSIRNANNLFVKGKTESIDKMAEAIIRDFGSRKIPDKKMSVIARNLINKIGWDYEKLYYALDRIGSDSFTELVMNVANSENIVMQDVMEAEAFLNEMVEKYGFNNWDVNKEIDRVFLDNTGKKFKLTLGQLMALYAYSRREGAWDHIEYGGFVFGEAALTNPKPADSYKLNQEQCKAITSLLTEEQKNYVKDMQKFLSETMGEKGNEVSMLLYGIKMFGEKNYFPIHIAGQFKAQANESQAKAAAGFQSMSNAGFTHAQNPNSKAPFVLEGFNEVWVDHVNEMSRYHGTVPALEDMRRVMNRSSYSEATAESMAIKQLMENSFGKEAVDYFDNLYREANSGAITDKMQKHSQKLLSMFRKNSVAYSMSVLIQQSASIVRAYALIDPKYFAGKGFGTITSGVYKAVTDKWTKAHTNAYNEMLKYAPGVTMAKEIGGFDTATGGSIRSYLLDTNKSFKQKWKTGTTLEKGKAVLDVVDNNVIANLPNLADKIAWIEIWNACKREAIHKYHNLKPSSDEFLKLVGERFTEVIRATQVYDSIFAKSPMLKSKSLAVQYLVSFMNESNTTANMAESALRDFIRGDKKTGFRKAVVLVHSIIFTGVLKSIIYAMRDDDEDETYIEKYIEAIVGSLMDDFNPLNYIPLVRDVWSLAQGYDVERADMAIVADAIDSLSAVIENTLKDTEHMTEKELIEFDKKCTEDSWKLAESLAAFFGIPMKNIRREIDAVLDHARIAKANMGKTTKAGIKYAIEEAWTGKSVPDKVQLYEARMAGDTEHAARVEARYDDAESANAAVRAAIKDSFIAGEIDESTALKHMVLYAGMDADEAYWLMDAWKHRSDDEYGKYNNLYDAVRTGTDLEGVIKTYTDNGIKPSTLTGQITEEFKPEYVQLTPKERSAMRKKLVNAFVLCGMEQKDAEEKLDSWDFEAEHGFAYSDRKEAYENGEVSRSELVAILVGRGYSPEDANAQIDSYEWEAEGYEDVTYAAIRNYNTYCAPAGISKAVYVSFWEFEKDTENDVNEATGKPIAYSAVRKIMAYINSLNLTPAQKDALAKSAGWKDSTIKKYKLW